MQLVAGSTTIDIPNDLEWVNEYGWSEVEQSTDRSVTGALIVEHGTKTAGRPITLQGRDDQGWVSRSTLDALYSLAAVPGQVMTLTNAEGNVYSVIFDHTAGAIEARRAYFITPANASTDYAVTLRFLTTA